MKVFITFMPQQPPGGLRLSKYHPQGNERLEFEPTRFPIIPVINGYADAGESIRIIAICQDHPHCRHNMELFREEIEALFAAKQYVSAAKNGDLFDVMEVKFDDAVANHIDTFSRLTKEIHDGDVLHACITYGTKPATVTELMALRYIRQFVKDTHIACITYGQFDWDAKICKIYDETALVYLDDIIKFLGQSGVSNPGEMLRYMIGI